MPLLSLIVYFRWIDRIDFSTYSVMLPIFVFEESNISKSRPIVRSFYLATATIAPVEFDN